MKNMEFETKGINKIIKKIIEELDSSREQIFEIIDSIRTEHENLSLELSKIIENIHRTINEVDILEKQDKAIRLKLAEVSSNFNYYKENDIKAAYEKASDSRIRLITKKNEEKSLKERRYSLELSLKRLAKNIESAEKIINQIGIALGYLEGDIFSVLEDEDKNSEMLIGIKILEAQENERKRIARDIHDGPAQHIASIMLNIDVCKRLLKANLEEGLSELESLKNSVKLALKEVRGIIFDLRPSSLEELGLNLTLQETVKRITDASDIDVIFKLKPISTEIELIIQIAVYRIVQEIFNNIKKHSKAKHVEVKLDFGTKYLILIISDDGVGFNVEETLAKVRIKGTSYGIIGILDRVNQLQGEFQIKSSENTGTTYHIKLPINREVIKNEK